jgi:predicted transposase YbfD/YdcC
MVLPPNQSLLPAPEKKLNRVKPIVEALDKVYEELSPTSPPVVLKEKTVMLEFFSKLEDPRIDRRKRHILSEIIVMAILAVISGSDDWVGIEEFGKDRYHWFKQFLLLPNGVPSHDTFGRVFSLISPTAFEACFIEWINWVRSKIPGEVVAIDGKTLRRSHDLKNGKSAIHMVSAWASDQALVLGQLKTDQKSNEITAIPQLIELLDLSGCIVTIDAMGCQKDIARLIVNKNADYVLTLKENHEKLFHEVETFFLKAEANNFQGSSMNYCQTETKNHGRLEIRRYWITDQISEFENTHPWKNLKSIGMVESQRTVKGETSIERRFFISSLENNVQLFAKAVRLHWGIENTVHWVLDIGFREDESRIRTGHAPENMAVLRHIALNLLRNDETRLGIKNKRLRAARSTEYLTQLLQGKPEKVDLI